jgi:hypothetical protein
MRRTNHPWKKDFRKGLKMRKFSTMVALLAAGLLLSGTAFAQTYPDGCGVSIAGVQGTCQSTNCATWDATNRVYRGGSANLSTCEEGGSCSVYPATTNVYDAYYYSTTTPNAQCNCIEIVFDTGACSYSVHSMIYAGIVPGFSTFACNDGLPGNPDWFALGDEGSSLPLTYSAELPPGGPTNNPGTYTIMNMSNFGTGSRGCTYSFNIVCRTTESGSCMLAPIETKIDELELVPQTGKKRKLCHIPPGNPDNAHIIEIGLPAVDPHMRLHGDCLVQGEKGDPCSCP